MKHFKFTFLLTVLMSMVGIGASAHDIEVQNGDGVFICYKYVNNKTELAVTYEGSSYDSNSNEYTGAVNIPSSVKLNGKTYSVTSIDSYAFRDCRGLTSVTIPNSVTTIGIFAFYGCNDLTSVTIPNSVTRISSFAFEGCSRLESVTIPNSVTSIGSEAFYGCRSLTSIEIPNSVTSIGSEAFAYCYGTAWYDNQPNGLVYAGKVAYKYKGTMPSNTKIVLKEGTLEISGEAFYGCSSLTSIEIPNSVTTIGYDAFDGCSGLTSITIPNSVTIIEESAFRGCSGLTSVTIPNSVTSIGSDAFSGCI